MFCFMFFKGRLGIFTFPYFPHFVFTVSLSVHIGLTPSMSLALHSRLLLKPVLLAIITLLMSSHTHTKCRGDANSINSSDDNDKNTSNNVSNNKNANNGKSSTNGSSRGLTPLFSELVQVSFLVMF